MSDISKRKELIEELNEIQNKFQKFDYDFKPKNYFEFPLGNNESYSESLKMLGKEFLSELKENEVEIAYLGLLEEYQNWCLGMVVVGRRGDWNRIFNLYATSPATPPARGCFSLF